ncbi:hypothetical protein BV898_14392 [Hypsibius exemplaris]|uniref:Uncharacterized protein n=1 Tax=Hypsibius exemplaris TaxID=2072580 RepID=A0A9X6N9F5_HYPEX|nr:hypothetical protein BV898_14392 [Hypsibius exemplaris]
MVNDVGSLFVNSALGAKLGVISGISLRSLHVILWLSRVFGKLFAMYLGRFSRKEQLLAVDRNGGRVQNTNKAFSSIIATPRLVIYCY